MFVSFPPVEDPSEHAGALVALFGESATGSLAGLSGSEGGSCRHSYLLTACSCRAAFRCIWHAALCALGNVFHSAVTAVIKCGGASDR